MITPSFSLTATERVLPRLALDFTTAVLDPRVTFTRSGNTATVIDSSGVIVAINADLPRFDFNPTTLVCRGLLIEEARTNALVNSLIDGTDLATQLVTVTAAARTLSFYGTGTVVLSGAHSATVVGTGAYPTRTTLTFTPSAGVLTLTVTGTVQFAQLEAGAFATSFIPTAALAVTRSGDVASMTGTNFSSWWNATEGSFVNWYVLSDGYSTAQTPRVGLGVSDGTTLNRIRMFVSSATTVNVGVVTAGSTVASLDTNVSNITTTVNKTAVAYKLNSFASSSNGGTPVTDSVGAVPTVNVAYIGSIETGTTSQINGHVQKIFYWPQRLTNAELQAISK